MKKKIAFVSGWYNFGGNQGISDDNRFIINCLYESAKKYFLPSCDVDFFFISNDDIKIDNVNNIKIDYPLTNFWHMCLMKILSIKFLPKEYDYIFVNDTDQVFVDFVSEDILENNFNILDHWHDYIENVHSRITKKISLEFNDVLKKDMWTLGNFFGGKSKNVYELLDFTEKIHNEYFNLKEDFYTIYPEELFLIKYVYEKKINFNRLKSRPYPNPDKSDNFLSTFNNDTVSLFGGNHVSSKLLHDTKNYISTLKEKFYLI